VIDQGGVIIAGNETANACAAEGLKEVLVVDPKPGQLVEVRRSDWSETEKTGYGIADNQVATGSFFAEELSDAVRSLSLDGFDLGALGFSDDKLKELLGEGGEIVNDPNGEWKGMPEFSQDDQLAKLSVKVNFLTEADLIAFAKLVKQSMTTKTAFIWFPAQEGRDVKSELIVSES
jgi:hypothetical protein